MNFRKYTGGNLVQILTSKISLVLLTLLALTSCVTLGKNKPSVAATPYGSIPPNQPIVQAFMIGQDKAVITSAPQFAGAISSLTFRGQEYVNSADHGRLMQGAISYNGRLECLNPTQAGASRDSGRRSMRSTSQRGISTVSPYAMMETSTRMAYWLAPGMSCIIPGQGRSPVTNTTRLSGDIYTITHNFGFHGRANVVKADISYRIERAYDSAVVEALTIYTPPQFDTFHVIDPETGDITLQPTLIPEETKSPAILSTADGGHAIAFISLQKGATYARFRFPDSNKISLVYRENDGISGLNHYHAAWIIGTRQEVIRELKALNANNQNSDQNFRN